MNSSGVPAQGVVVAEATTAKKRGDRSMGHPNGFVGKGTAGSRLKSHWRKSKSGLSLSKFVEKLAEYKGTEPASVVWQKDATTWLTIKSGGTPEQKSARKLRRKERKSDNLSAKLARKGKGKQQQKKAA